MSPPELRGAVQQAGGESLENMAFVEALPFTSAGQPGENEKWLWASIGIRQPASGNFVMGMPKPLASMLVSIIYGVDSGSEDSMERDTVAEVANIMAGRLLSSLLKESVSFQLSPPTVEYGTAKDKGINPGEGLYFQVDDIVFAVWFDNLDSFSHS